LGVADAVFHAGPYRDSPVETDSMARIGKPVNVVHFGASADIDQSTHRAGTFQGAPGMEYLRASKAPSNRANYPNRVRYAETASELSSCLLADGSGDTFSTRSSIRHPIIKEPTPA
jgi:hypothetical protein